jgi:small-conductance mechanosensitive channel/CRP-like cAMP-binding protein
LKRRNLKQQLTLPTLLVILFALARYFIIQTAPTAISFENLTNPQNNYHWALRLVEVALWLSLSFIIVRLVGTLVFFIFRKRKGQEAPRLMRDIFALVAYVISIAFILSRYFPDLSFGALLSGSAVLGIIVGLALQDTLGNLFAGISLHADRPFQVGDVITVGAFTGVVESITWRAVKIRTFQNHIILVSNTSIAKESIEVCPHTNPNARIVFFNALYTDSPAKIIEVVREAVREVENVRRYMTPVVRVRGLGESGVDYEVKYWLEDYARHNDTDALVRQRIWYAFRRHNFNFAYPTRTLHVERRAAADNGHALRDGIKERLSAIDIFTPLSPEELTRLAESAESLVFAPGETIIREGERGASMFVLHQGRVEVQINDHGRTRIVNTLQEGDFFGEMALFTGEPRTANVVAADETEVLEIGHAAIKHLFLKNPDLVESLSHTISERRAALAANTEAATDDKMEPAGLLAVIKRFFRLD